MTRKQGKIWPLWQKIFVTLTLSMLLVAFTGSLAQYRIERQYMQRFLQWQNQKNFQLLHSAVISPVIAEDLSELQHFVELLVERDHDLFSIRIFNAQNKSLLDWQRSSQLPNYPLMQFNQRIIAQGQPFGHVEVSWSVDHFYQIIEDKIFQTLMFAISMMLLLTVLIMLLVFKQAVEPIKKINKLVTLYLSRKKIHSNLTLYSSNELRQLADSVEILGQAFRQQLITEQELRRTKQEVEELSRRNDLILSSAGEGVCVIDHQGRTIYVNPAAVEMTGWQTDELMGKGLACLFQNPELGSVKNCSACIVESEKNSISDSCEIFSSILDGQRHHVNHAIFWHKKGESFPVEFVSTPIIENEFLSGVVIVFKDISQRIKIEQQVKDSEALKLAMLESSLDAIITIDEQGLICEFNREAERMFLYLKQDVLAKNIADIVIPPQQRKAHKNGFKKYLSTKQSKILSRRIEVLALRSNGKEFPVEMMITPISLHNKLYFTAFLKDISDQKKAREAIENAKAQAEKANAAKSQFLAAMSHEIRTPLNAIIGINDLLQTTKLDREQAGYVEIAQQSSFSLREIVNDILDFSKIEAGMLELELKPVNPVEIVDVVLAIMAPKALERGLELYVWVEYPVPQCIFVDPARLKQILLNLISNAIKFTESGSVEIRLGTSCSQQGKLYMTFSVRDTGIGIAEECIKDLFNEFTQADISTTRKYGGTGLGLAIANRLVTMSGGEIGVESTPDLGSRFWFTLPAFDQLCIQPEKLDYCRCWVFDTGQQNNYILVNQLKAFCSEVHLFSSMQEILLSGNTDLMFMEESQLGRVNINDFKSKVSDKLVRILVTSSSQPNIETYWQHFFHKRLIKPIQVSQLQDFIVECTEYETHAEPVLKEIVNETFYGEGFRVLLVEDSLANQLVIKTMLTKAGFTVDMAGDGLEATKKVADKRYDIILMDLSMPIMGGLAATQLIRKTDGFNQATPIIALTANAFQENREQCLQVGMNGFLAKPLSLSSLLMELKKFLKIKIIKSGEKLNVQTDLSTIVCNDPVIDHNVLQELKVETSEEIFPELLRVFMQQGEERVKKIDQAIQSQNLELLEAEIHSFKSESGTFGAIQLSDLTKQINLLCRLGDREQAFNLAKNIKQYWLAVLKQLETG